MLNSRHFFFRFERCFRVCHVIAQQETKPRVCQYLAQQESKPRIDINKVLDKNQVEHVSRVRGVEP